MSGGSFNYLSSRDDPGLSEELEHMVSELEALAGEDVPGAEMAAAESRIIRGRALAIAASAYDPEDALRSVWHAIEWWRSGDWSREQAVEALARYAEARAAVYPPVEVVYRNHRGDVSTRRVRPLLVRFGATVWHPRPQWLLEVWDVEIDAVRTFALADCDFDGATW